MFTSYGNNTNKTEEVQLATDSARWKLVLSTLKTFDDLNRLTTKETIRYDPETIISSRVLESYAYYGDSKNWYKMESVRSTKTSVEGNYRLISDELHIAFPTTWLQPVAEQEKAIKSWCANKQLTVVASTAINQVSVYNLNGTLAFSAIGQGKSFLQEDLSNLTPGLYMLLIHAENSWVTSKLFVK
ncbi:MAG: T9SS type A sorting domain-containing protein [Bacteroidales bacterium]|nr:T9SS type A sorting domain-containing protein [Bacteroidales bacterium]